MKPRPGLALLFYPDSFDPDMSYSLRERNPTTLEEMIRNSVSVEANLFIKKSKLKTECKVTIKEEPSTSFDTKFDDFLGPVVLYKQPSPFQFFILIFNKKWVPFPFCSYRINKCFEEIQSIMK